MSSLSYNARYSKTTDFYSQMTDASTLDDNQRGDISTGIQVTANDGEGVTLFVVMDITRVFSGPIRIEVTWDANYANVYSAFADSTINALVSSDGGYTFHNIDETLPGQRSLAGNTAQFLLDANFPGGARFLEIRIDVPRHEPSLGHLLATAFITDLRLDTYPVYWHDDFTVYDLESGDLTDKMDDVSAQDVTTKESTIQSPTGSGSNRVADSSHTVFADCGPFSDSQGYGCVSVIDSLGYGALSPGGVSGSLQIHVSTGKQFSTWQGLDWLPFHSVSFNYNAVNYRSDSHIEAVRRRYWKMTVTTHTFIVGSSGVDYALAGASDWRFVSQIPSPPTPTLEGYWFFDTGTELSSAALSGT